MKKILLAGGTGLIGARLKTLLQEKGYDVILLTRKPMSEGQYAWDPAKGQIDEAALEGVHAVINLAGAGIAEGRWTAVRKKILVDSRVQSAETLIKAVGRMPKRPAIYLSASAIGYYGNSGERMMLEQDAPADDSFMVQCCQAWEQAATQANQAGMRFVALRIGVVLAKEGGALREIARPIRFGLGAYFGNGRAWYSWIHIDDVCRMFIWALEHETLAGVYNAVAPKPARNYDLVRQIAAAMGKFVLMIPTPSFALKLLLGEMSAVVLNSNLVSAQKVLDHGFQFTYPELSTALGQIYRKNEKG